MSDKTLTIIRAGMIALAALLFLGVAVPQKSSAADERQAISLTPEERAFVLGEMRQMLASVAGIVSALEQDDWKAIAPAARASGLMMAQHAPAGLRAKLPAEFRRFGHAVHIGFDKIASEAMVAEVSDDKKKILGLLAENLNRCMACHATYRLK